MNIIVAMDSFKGSLSSVEVGEAIREGIIKADKDAEVIVSPLADGGEGTVEALVHGMGGMMKRVTVIGPTGELISSSYGIIEDTRTAIIEMASASGLTLVPEEQRNPLYTTTYGVGQLIRDAIAKGCRRFLIGIGGSATNDGGVGMLQALGYSFLDKNGNQIVRGAIGLKDIEEISDAHAMPELKECTFRIACDVTNPLCGQEGCSVVFAPQKGATEKMVDDMDQWMRHYVDVLKQHMSDVDSEYPGSGAAGGLGFAFHTFLHAQLEAGVQIVLDEIQLQDKIKAADLVITGEGRLDGQTVMGKAPIGVAKLAKQYGKPVVALAGSVSSDASACNEEGIDAFFPVLRNVCTLQEAMERENAIENIRETAEQVIRLYNLTKMKGKCNRGFGRKEDGLYS